jgi:hypothetical protein
MASDLTAETADEHEEDHHPKGTFVLMLCFLGLIAAMWIWMYVTLILQGN